MGEDESKLIREILDLTPCYLDLSGMPLKVPTPKPIRFDTQSFKPVDYFGLDKKLGIGQGQDFGRFRVLENGIYHGTNLEALDLLLADGVMRIARELLIMGKLVYGELAQDMKRDGDNVQKGPKFMSRRKMVEMGMISKDDPHFYAFGGADDLFFDSLMGAHSYTPGDSTQKAIIGLDRKVLEFNGEKFINTLTSAGSEGLIHEGSLNILMGLRQVLVPEAKVEEYKDMVEGRYLAKVYAIESSN